MEVEHQMEDDVGVEEEMGDEDDEKQRRRVPEPEQLDDYPGGPQNTIVLTRYHIYVARMAADGEVK